MIKRTFWWGRARSQLITSDVMHMNSLYLMVSTGILAVIGFLFWIVAARTYTPAQIGLGASLVSLGGLLIQISGLGFSETLIRFLPMSKYPDRKISTALIVTGLMAVIVSIVFWFISQIWFIEIHNLISTPLTFSIFVIALVAGIWQKIENSIFIAKQKTQWIMLESTIYAGTKLASALPLVFLGGYGIFTSNYLGLGAGTIISIIVLIIYYKINPLNGFHKSIINEVGKYSIGSYVINILGILPAQLLPAIVTKHLGSVNAAYFFLAQMMVSLLLIIPQASSQTLLAQTSKEKTLFREYAVKSLKLQLFLLTLGIGCLWFFGGLILKMFGNAYLIDTQVALRILSLSTIPSMVNFILGIRLRVIKKIKRLILISMIGTVLIITTSIFFSQFGLAGIASGYVLGQILLFLVHITFFIFEKKRA